MARSFVRRVAGRGVREARALKHRLVPTVPAPEPALVAPAPEGPTWTPALTDLDVLTANVKNLGYEVARRRVEEVLSTVDTSAEPRHHGMVSKATTQADMESPWAAYWCASSASRRSITARSGSTAVCCRCCTSRACCAAVSAAWASAAARSRSRACFAAYGMRRLITDLARSSAGKGWVATSEHAACLEEGAFKPTSSTADAYRHHVRHASST